MIMRVLWLHLNSVLTAKKSSPAAAGAKPKLTARPAFADSFAADGCSYVTRNFTPEEWLAYVGKDITYEKTCSGADYKIKIREIR